MRLFEGTEFDIPPRCDRCQQLEQDCQCPPEVEPPLRIPPEKQQARVQIEKRKRGKTVTVVRGLPANGNDLPSLLTTLKATCGAGGTVKEDTVEIQGSHVDRVCQALRQMGYKTRN